MNGIYPNDVGISKTERMGSTEYAVTSNVDKYELHRNGQYLGNGEKLLYPSLIWLRSISRIILTPSLQV